MKFLYTIVTFPFLVVSALFLSCKSDGRLNIVYPEGGYPYRTSITSEDSNFYFLPIQKKVSRRDSIIICTYTALYSAFNEPNLSITPPSEDIFRFFYESPFLGEIAVFTLTPNTLIIKTIKTGSPYKAPNEDALDSSEKLQLNLLNNDYPLTEVKVPEWRRQYIDSLIKVYPQLLNPAYYLNLIDRVFSINQGHFEYSLKKVKISKPEFFHIVNLINQSDYWERPFYNTDCSIMDGEGIFLEAITKRKYQNITFTLCPYDSSNLRKAYNEVLKYAGVEEGKLGRQDSIPNSSEEKIRIKEVQLKDIKKN